MGSDREVITAYDVALPEKQEQNLPGLDKKIAPGLEYTRLEEWDEEGNPRLVEYQGTGKLKNKAIIVTGGDSGIGRAAAIAFAREGAAGITITYLPQEKADAEDAKKDIEASGAKVVLVKVDLINEEDCKRVVDEHVKAFGRIDVLVNNASKQNLCADLAEIDLKEVHNTFQTNILQMITITKYALPHMKRGTSIINTTSVTAYKGSSSLIDYSSTKGAIVTFTRSLSIQLAPKGIRVNAVAPGVVITALQAGSRSEDDMEALGLGTPIINRGAQPAEMAPTYVYLASARDSNFMTGAVLHINGGQHIGGS
ncbi:hypothetical protein BD626DRAFT_492466 [Schizophyllum amplum]|uniref:Oxidoreductase n=1 Tax=Schizophyllum amplum TaxID=97359 RepID=A0A550CIH6_9AGAR|nr:hypothetical protein BD626DRAFT_492466 [Auriculariopsis ampla]